MWSNDPEGRARVAVLLAKPPTPDTSNAMTQTKRYTQVFHVGVPIVRLTIEKNEKGGACSTYWERESVYGVVVWKCKGKRQLERPRGIEG